MLEITADQPQLDELETAARTLCQLRGIDPDAQERTPHPMGLMVEHTTPAWKLAAEEVLAVMQILAAINAQRREQMAQATAAMPC